MNTVQQIDNEQFKQKLHYFWVKGHFFLKQKISFLLSLYKYWAIINIYFKRTPKKKKK